MGGFVYDGHGHRVEVVPRWGGFGRSRILFDGRELEPAKRLFRSRAETTVRDGSQTVAWAIEVRSGPYGELQVSVWRAGHLVTGWS